MRTELKLSSTPLSVLLKRFSLAAIAGTPIEAAEAEAVHEAAKALRVTLAELLVTLRALAALQV